MTPVRDGAQVPTASMLIAGLAARAGLPAGVLSILHGGKVRP